MPPKQKCPCCNTDYSETQIRRHLQIQRERLARELPNHFNNDGGNGKGAGLGAGVGGNGAADDGIVEGEGEGDMGLGDEGLDDPAAEMGLDNAEPAPDDAPWAAAPHGVIGDYAPIRGIIQNPPLIINNWDDPPEESDGSDNEDENEGEGKGDPEYIEHDLPLELNPLDEPRLADEEIRRILVHELGDLADEEWAGISTLFIRTGRKHSSPSGHPPSYTLFTPDVA
ncbi:hypothetical protein FRC12_009619 [Ceratobasidium sp. 428]|nr:hypothetical protein FRC12_009619 [Ceratobasidium sp. 428]